MTIVMAPQNMQAWDTHVELRKMKFLKYLEESQTVSAYRQWRRESSLPVGRPN